jgi:hypothetical protein
MINNDLYFTFIKIKCDYKTLLVCKYWYANICKHLKKKKEDFYDIQLYNAIQNKHIYILYNKTDDIIIRAHDNIVNKLMNDIYSDNDIKHSIMNNIIENYKKLSIIITLFNKNTSANNIDNIEKYIAEEYAKILSVYYDYNIILA